MKVDFIDIILFVLFFQLLSLAPFLILQKKEKNQSNIILAVFLFAKALCISNFLSFRLQDYTLAYFPHSFFFGSSFTLLWGPSLYFYIKSLTHKDFKIRKGDSIHLLPFLIHFIYLTFTFHIQSADIKRELIISDAVFPTNISMFVYGFLHASIVLYTIASFRMVWQYRSEIKNSLSSIDLIHLSWLYFVLIGFTMKWVFDVWFFIRNFSGTYDLFPLTASRVTLFLFINIMIYKGLKQPEIFAGINGKSKQKKLSLSSSLKEQYLQKLQSYMNHEKPYLNPDISLSDLAEKVAIPHRSLSEVINNALGKNFYDFINYYRIKESKRLLAEPSVNSKTILEILYEVGFNSKFSFNSAFKKHTGMTPSQFKNRRCVS